MVFSVGGGPVRVRRAHGLAGRGTGSGGCGDRIVLGTDGARRDLWKSLGGAPGLAWLATGFRNRPATAGVGESDLRRLHVGNPARALALRSTSRR